MAKKLLTIDDSLLDKVKMLSIRRKTNQQALIIQAIEDYVDKFELPPVEEKTTTMNATEGF